MFIPSESAVQSRALFCPCGEIERIGKEVINQVMSRQLRSHVAKKSGRLYRPTAELEERTKMTHSTKAGDASVELI